MQRLHREVVVPLQAFFSLIGISLTASVAALSLRQLLVGELFGVAAIIAALVALVGFFLAWPLSLVGIGILAVLISAALLAGITLHYAFTYERSKLLPNFEIEIHRVEIIPYPFPSQAAEIIVELTLHNHGADSAARRWSPIVQHADGHRSFYSDTSLRTFPAAPDGSSNIVLNTASVPRNGRIAGSLIFNAQTSRQVRPDELFKEFKQITISVSDYMGGRYTRIASADPSLGASLDEQFTTTKTYEKA